MIEGVDCASTITNPAALKAAGKHFACRYLSTPGNPKNLKATEATSLHAAGVMVVSVFETTANRALDGRVAGVSDATTAASQARELGAPTDVPIYFAVDFDMSASEWPAVRGYFDGAASVLGRSRVGGYGGKNLTAALRKRRIGLGLRRTCAYVWQTYAWSGTPTEWVGGCQLQQYENGVTVAGVACDLDRALVADYGQWARPPAPKKWKRPKGGVTVEWTDTAGQRVASHHGGLGRFQLRHPRAWWRGEIVAKPKK
jgi:hypothetical protein